MLDKSDEGEKIARFQKLKPKRLQALKNYTSYLTWKPSYCVRKDEDKWALYRQKLSAKTQLIALNGTFKRAIL